jgi:putative tryptophan/tyrosine transport system substrate-binding protein
MNRREFITLLGGMAGTWPFAARAQQSGQMRRLGVLMSVVENDPGGVAEVADLRQGLAELGWVTDRNINIDFRWPGGDLDRAKALAKELVDLKPEVLLARSTPTTAALKRESDSIPIVFVNVTEPVQQGFVQSLAQPGGNITGFTNFESMVGGKWLQLLKEVDPRITRVGLIYNPQTAPYAKLFLRSVQSAAPMLSVQTVDLPVHSDADIEAALAMLGREPGAGLVAIPDSFTTERRDLINGLTTRYRLPSVYGIPSATPSGALMAFAVDSQDSMRRAAGYVDRILRGAKPADLPVQQATKFTLSMNLKTAKALGLEIPASLVATADEVIE